jgi:hypothetical protein
MVTMLKSLSMPSVSGSPLEEVLEGDSMVHVKVKAMRFGSNVTVWTWPHRQTQVSEGT